MVPQIIINAVKSKTHDVNLTDSGSSISASGPHGRRCSEYYADLNEVLDMIDSVNPNFVILVSAGFVFLTNPNRTKKDIYIVIVSNMLEFPSKVIFSGYQACADSHFYDYNPRKTGGGKSMVTTDGREICMFISDGIAYLPVRCPNIEDTDSYPTVLLTPAG